MSHLYAFINPVVSTEDFESDEDERGNSIEIRSVLSSIWGFTRSLLRHTLYLLPSAIREEKNWNWINVSGGVAGFVIGSALKQRFHSLWIYGSATVFIARLLLDFGIISVNWERVEEIQRMLRIDTVLKKVPIITQKIVSVPFGGFLTTGMLVGVKFG